MLHDGIADSRWMDSSNTQLTSFLQAQYGENFNFLLELQVKEKWYHYQE